MVFSSLSFIFVFLPVFLIIYYCSPRRLRNTLLLIGSLIFYSFGEPYYLFLIICSITINYLLGRLIEHFDSKKGIRCTFFIISLLYNLGTLFVFKYADFFITNINLLLKAFNINWQFYLWGLTLPLGISFYTFQIMSYVIDVYTYEIKADKSIISLGAYLCMFPQLIAGPIVVYSNIKNELSNRTVSVYKLDNGLKTFIIGLGYKVIIANRIGTLWNEVCTIGYESISTPLAWLGAFAYSMQLYFDFCGYSMMAIGLGEMLGFTMPANFKHPYMARSVTDFWRRWHITLGAWFKEYVYIPLGGNRKGKLRTMLNLFVVWFLVGFWHGADWNFIIWGLFILLFQILEKNIILKFLNGKNIFSFIISHIYMIFYILISWTIFAISDFKQLWIYINHLFPFINNTYALNFYDFVPYLKDYAVLIVLCIIFATDYPEKLFNRIKNKFIGILISFGIFWYAVYFLSLGMNNPFLYFRF